LLQEKLVHIILVEMVPVPIKVKGAMNDSWERKLDLCSEKAEKPVYVIV